MVSADSLNLDTLETIFSYLSGRDLAAVALVSNSFLAAVIPHLYRTLSFRTRHAKKYPKVSTSFSSILTHPRLAVHVKHIDVRDMPISHGTNNNFSSFIRDCTRVVDLCANLESFTFTKDTVTVILPKLQGKSRLRTLRIHARFTTEQANMAIKLTGIQKLTLDYASWNMLNLLPKWATSIRNTLSNLTLYMSTDLNREVLEQTLRQLPHLTGLHVIGCPGVDHIMMLKLIVHTPHLESLSFTATDFSCPSESLTHPLYNLSNLAIELRQSPIIEPSSSQLTVTSILLHLKKVLPPLTSLTLRVRDLKPSNSRSIVQTITANYGLTLRRLCLIECGISIEALTLVCKKCIHLEHLTVPILIKDMFSFTTALSHSSTIRTVVDAEAHLDHTLRVTVNKECVKYMMQGVPSLQKIISAKRIWTGERNANGELHVSFEPRTAPGPTAHWFMPPSRSI